MAVNRWKIDDNMYAEILKGLSGSKKITERTTHFLHKFPNLKRKNNKVFFENRQLITTGMLDKILNDELITGSCPMSCEGAYYYLRDKYCGALTRGKVTKWIQSLENYQKERVRPPNPNKTKGDYARPREGVTRFLLAKGSGGDWNTLGADLMYLSRHWTKWKYLLVVVHLRSGFSWFEPLSERTAKSLIAPFKRIVRKCEKRFDCVVKKLQTDPGVEFMGDFLEYLTSQKIELINEFKSYHSERKIGQFGRCFGRLLSNNVGFNKALVLAASKLNNTKSRVTGMKPVDVRPNTKLKPPRKLQKGKRKKKKEVEFVKGDTVRYLKKHADQLNSFYKSYGALSRLEKHENWSAGVHTIVEKKFIFGEPRYRLGGEKKWRKPWELAKIPPVLRKLKKPKESLALPAGTQKEIQRLQKTAPSVRVDRELKNIQADLGTYWKPVTGKRRRKKVSYSS